MKWALPEAGGLLTAVAAKSDTVQSRRDNILIPCVSFSIFVRKTRFTEIKISDKTTPKQSTLKNK